MNRHVQLAYVPIEYIWELLRCRQHNSANIAKLTGIPDDAELEDVRQDYPSDCFVFKFSHPSFPETPAGAIHTVAAVTFEIRHGHGSGLKDKHGREIFDGDRITTTDNGTGTVKYNLPYAMFFVIFDNEERTPLFLCVKDCEVVERDKA